MIEPLVIEHEGKPTHVLLRFAERERIRGIIEDAEYREAVRRAESDPNQDRIPLEIVKRLIDDENPLQGVARASGVDAAASARGTVA